MVNRIRGYENDIFISYRQNDNRNDGWVSEFVANLKRELEATIKEKLNIWVDENPHDGLLETHNVDKSLSNKLNSLIFIPVLSHTYCDQNSYAWQNEFLVFNRISSEDHFKKEILLRNGNVAGRILPIRIHDLDPDDLRLLQEELGGPLRAIDFVFRQPGVNRPLRPDDSEDKNLNKTRYRNQVNKVANAIREILISMQNPGKAAEAYPEEIPAIDSADYKSIAVLPFVNMSNDPEQEYFSDGISEEIINTLVQIRGLKVAGRTSAFSFKNKNEDLRSIGEKLNVNTILEGSVRKSGNNIRVNAQLIEAYTGFHLWSEKFDRELNDIFIVQDEIARAIFEKLKVTFAGKPAEPRQRVYTPDVQAYQLYLKGRFYSYKRGLNLYDALAYFSKALDIDPDYPLALAGLADAYTLLCLHSYMPPEEAWPKASASANRALKTGREISEVHSAVAIIAMLFERNWDKAEKEYLTALELNPNYLQGRSWYAMFFLQRIKSEHQAALELALQNLEYDPLSSYAHIIFSVIASNAGKQDEAIVASNRSVEHDQESFLAWYYLGHSNHWAGNIPSAIAAYKQAIAISGRHNWPLVSLFVLLNEPSEYQDAREADFIYRELIAKEKLGYVSPSLLAIVSAAAGKKDNAIRYAIQAFDRHDPFLHIATQVRPDNKALREIPEVIELMNGIGLK